VGGKACPPQNTEKQIIRGGRRANQENHFFCLIKKRTKFVSELAWCSTATPEEAKKKKLGSNSYKVRFGASLTATEAKTETEAKTKTQTMKKQ
jgi:hypothetical protein